MIAVLDGRDRPGTIAERHGAEIARLRAAGLTQKEVGERLGISKASAGVVDREMRSASRATP